MTESDRFVDRQLPDPRQWRDGLLANWKLLVAGMLILPAIVAAVGLMSPHRYTAEALIAPSRSITQVQFEPKIKTVDDSASGTQPGGSLTPERRQALVDLVHSGEIEQQVIQALQGQVPDTALIPGELQRHISGSIRPRSEIISIQSDAPSEATAMAITNAWAAAYVQRVNYVYTSNANAASIASLRDNALQDLQTAQAALTASLKDSQLEQLDRQIQDDQHRIALLQSPYQAGAFSQSPQTNNQSQSTSDNTNPSPTPSAPAPVDAQTARSDYRLAEVRTLDDLAQTVRRLDATRENLRALIDQESTGDSAGNGVALSLLKAQLVSISDGLPAQTQLQLPAAGSGSVQELQALAQSIDQARAQVQQEFDTRRTAYEQQRTEQIAQLESELRDLQSRREAADAQRKELTLKRDLASDTYNALARKAQEEQVAEDTSGHEVELASQATFSMPVSRTSPLTLGLAAVGGLLLAGVIALIRTARSSSVNRLPDAGGRRSILPRPTR